jgi:hypothetical protein
VRRQISELAGAAVAHFAEEFDDEAFEEVGRCGGNTCDAFRSEIPFELRVDRFDLFLWAFSLLKWWHSDSRRIRFLVFRGAEFYELWERVEESDIDSGGLGRE